MKLKKPTGKLAKWALVLGMHNIHVRTVPGVKMVLRNTSFRQTGVESDVDLAVPS
jgi:hypothetical protein